MENKLPPNDPFNLWQNQPTEQPKMSLEEIHRRARELQSKTRREFVTNVLISSVFIAFSAWSLATVENPAQRTGFALAIAWGLAAVYPVYKRLWSAKPAGDAAMSTSLEFYRTELERRRDHFRHTWVWVLGPILLTIAAFLVPAVQHVLRNPEFAGRMAPFLVLLTVWLIAFFFIRRQNLRKTDREIEELRAMEKQAKGG